MEISAFHEDVECYRCLYEDRTLNSGPANGNRHGWLKHDGGNKREGGQEWALSLLR
ncbi:hypothetical protein J6590_070293 [Homalodisca vitripennis]|nr:hypothetical protein J6590_070293 [Homalodisca vitripennis]